uniref:Uncharacterized protein n=1 Tax=Rhizophora mucronata TaxID=61149 RepID=A0A2P2PRX4_RHIMU
MDVQLITSLSIILSKTDLASSILPHFAYMSTNAFLTAIFLPKPFSSTKE